MTDESTQKHAYRLEFLGEGSEYFKVLIINWFLTVVTLGIYYPWARARRIAYMNGHTSLDGERFLFSGTGKEMFRGYIKVIVLYVMLAVVYVGALILEASILGVVLIYLSLVVLLPFAIHGALRYRMSRTSYRGIRFGYRGNRRKLAEMFFVDLFFTIITLGIYGPWFQMNIRRYTFRHIRYGDAEFSNNVKGHDWLLINLKGYLLTVLTLGVYVFWWQRDLFAYGINKIVITKGTDSITCTSVATAGGMFKLIVGNVLLVVFTVGLGKAWADVRTQKFLCDSIRLEGTIALDDIHQTEAEYTDAFGEDAMDFFEFDIA